jgi:hypothetical protein
MENVIAILFVIIIIPLSFLLFCGFWFGRLWILHKISGWSKLLQLYKTDQKPPANLIPHCRGKVGFITYPFTLRVGFTPQGLYLAVKPLFDSFDRPLLIPWSDIAVDPAGYSIRYGKLIIGHPTVTNIHLDKKIIKDIESSLGDRLPPFKE